MLRFFFCIYLCVPVHVDAKAFMRVCEEFFFFSMLTSTFCEYIYSSHMAVKYCIDVKSLKLDTSLSPGAPVMSFKKGFTSRSSK